MARQIHWRTSPKHIEVVTRSGEPDGQATERATTEAGIRPNPDSLRNCPPAPQFCSSCAYTPSALLYCVRKTDADPSARGDYL